MTSLRSRFSESIKFLQKEAPFSPEITLVLGSGLNEFAEQLTLVNVIPTNKIPNYPASTVEGHKGNLCFAEHEGKKLLIVQGRIHYYEGYSISQCVLPVVLGNAIGAEYLFLTNSAGGINSNFVPGDLMLINDFISVNLWQELGKLLPTASVDERNRMLNFPDRDVISLMRSASLKAHVDIKEGTYWFTKGPNYESPAEIQMMKRFGGDSVGMSTAHEAFYGHHLGMKVGSISLITNFAAGLSAFKLSHAEVQETALLAKNRFEKLLKSIITEI